MAASDSGERTSVRDKGLSLGTVLHAVSVILLGVMAWLSSRALNAVEDHEKRLIKVETKQDGQEELLKEIRADIKDLKKAWEKRP